MTTFINCKWMGQDVTGTQRFAAEIGRRLVSAGGGKPVLVLPANAVVPSWAKDGYVLIRSRFSGTVFEQIALPLITRGQLLVNLGGPAPMMKHRQIVTMHDASFVRLPETYSRQFVAWYKFMYRVLSKLARHVITVSAFSAGELRSFLKRPAYPMDVVPNGSNHMQDIEAVDPGLSFAADEPFALCVGTLAKHKNLVPVVSEFSKSGIPVVVVGAAGNSRVFSSDTGYDARGVVVAGRLTDGELKWLYMKATALVFPSLYEGFGLPVVEAQRCGCPVISSDHASLPEVGGAASLYYDPVHPEAAVQAFRKLVSDDVFRDRIIESGYMNSLRYTWEASAGIVNNLIAASE